MIMTTRKLMRFMPEAKQLDGNIWTWIVQHLDVDRTGMGCVFGV